MSFYFDGITKSYIRALRGVKRPAWAPIEHEIIDIPGRPGGYLSGKKIKVRVINVPIEVRGLNSSNLQSLKEEMASWLITDEPKELIFNDEPNRIYYAKVTGELDLDEIFWKGKGVITFICPDPYKYGPEQTEIISNDTITITNNGTAEADPVFDVEVLEPVTYMNIANDKGDYMQIGQPLSLEDVPFQRYQRILEDNMRNLNGWVASTKVEEGYVTGQILSDGNRFYVSTYGAAGGVHGPAVEKVLPETLQDFRVEFVPRVFNGTREAGRITLYLMDTNDNVIGRMTMYDKYNNLRQNFVEFRVGNKDNGQFITYTRLADNGNDYNDFYGMMRFMRDGDTYTAMIARINANGEYIDTHQVTRTMPNFSAARLAKIKIYIAKYNTEAESQQHVYKINVDKINQSADGIPYIAQTGDIITFDHVHNNLLINGESRIDLKGDLFSSYFSLKPGQNILVLSPFQKLTNAKIQWRERYK